MAYPRVAPVALPESGSPLIIDKHSSRKPRPLQLSTISTLTGDNMSVHADAPPPVVREPKRITYLTGAQLGKGGFAICHRAELCEDGKPSGKIVALKIVKSKMEPPKLAQKVIDLQISPLRE